MTNNYNDTCTVSLLKCKGIKKLSSEYKTKTYETKALDTHTVQDQNI